MGTPNAQTNRWATYVKTKYRTSGITSSRQPISKEEVKQINILSKTADTNELGLTEQEMSQEYDKMD
jgi:hypothetical protein